MSKRGNKWFVVLLLVAVSCANESQKRLDFFDSKLDDEQIKKIQTVRQLAIDTVHHWIQLKLSYWYWLDDYSNRWKVDEYVFFNSKRDKCVLSVPISVIEGQIDSISILLGEEIDGVWWFYDGPQYAVLRDGYSSDTSTPLSLEFLTYRARVNALSWYYKEKPLGTCLNKLFNEGYESYKKCSDEKYIINDQYFDTSFNLDADRKYHAKFLKEKFIPDTSAVTP